MNAALSQIPQHLFPTRRKLTRGFATVILVDILYSVLMYAFFALVIAPRFPIEALYNVFLRISLGLLNA